MFRGNNIRGWGLRGNSRPTLTLNSLSTGDVRFGCVSYQTSRLNISMIEQVCFTLITLFRHCGDSAIGIIIRLVDAGVRMMHPIHHSVLFMLSLVILTNALPYSLGPNKVSTTSSNFQAEDVIFQLTITIRIPSQTTAHPPPFQPQTLEAHKF
jgi:hypothetical protein